MHDDDDEGCLAVRSVLTASRALKEVDVSMADVDDAIANSSASDWVYLAEGGANIVLSYRGHDLPLIQRCLRLRKAKSDSNVVREGAEDPAVEYQSRVVAPLIGEEHLPWMRPVRVPRELLAGIRREIKSHRSPERQAEGDVDVAREIGVLVEDLLGAGPSTGTSVLTFEIKPKWANLPGPSAELMESTAELKRTYCRTCMFRLVRSTDDDLSSLTAPDRFCPLQLFSGHPLLVIRAIDSLYKLLTGPKGAGNNFRIFAPGKLVVNALDPEIREPTLRALADNLASSPALQKLAELQNRFDPYGLEHIANILLGAKKDPNLLRPVSIDELSRVADPERSMTPAQSAREVLVRYLVSATFKDCSLLVSMALGDDGPRVGSVKVIDLDPKPINRLAKYVEVDREIRQRFPEVQKKSGGMVSCADLLQS